MHQRRNGFWLSTVLLVGIGLLIATFSAPPVSAVTSEVAGCNASDCIGLNPAGLCDKDAATVASMSVPSFGGGFAGQLDLRYSHVCKANWGRYTPYKRNLLGIPIGAPVSTYGRVTVWNPGEPSQNPVHGLRSFKAIGSEWTNMVDGTKTACTGVEVFSYQHSDAPSGGEMKSEGWTWGPCV